MPTNINTQPYTHTRTHKYTFTYKRNPRLHSYLTHTNKRIKYLPTELKYWVENNNNNNNNMWNESEPCIPGTTRDRERKKKYEIYIKNGISYYFLFSIKKKSPITYIFHIIIRANMSLIESFIAIPL